MRLPQENVLDEALEHLVRAPEVEADQDAGDQHDHRALDHLLLARPLDLPQLRIGLADEVEEPDDGISAARRCVRGRRRSLGHTRGSSNLAPPRRGGRALELPALPALLTGLPRHYLVS